MCLLEVIYYVFILDDSNNIKCKCVVEIIVEIPSQLYLIDQNYVLDMPKVCQLIFYNIKYIYLFVAG